jgi:hypothetical protein
VATAQKSLRNASPARVQGSKAILDIKAVAYVEACHSSFSSNMDIRPSCCWLDGGRRSNKHGSIWADRVCRQLTQLAVARKHARRSCRNSRSCLRPWGSIRFGVRNLPPRRSCRSVASWDGTDGNRRYDRVWADTNSTHSAKLKLPSLLMSA